MQNVKQRVALSSIAASAGLTVAKAIVGVTSGSLAILSEAAHSLIDLGATVMTYFAVRVSGKPADAEHHYGHGKVESVTALAETALLFGLAGVVIWEAAKRLMSADPPQVEATRWAFAVMLLSIVVDFFRARVLYRTAQQTSSEALEADALHFSSDMWSSLAVVVGLIGITLGYARAELGGSDRCIGRHLHCGLAACPTHHRYADGYRPARRRRQNHRRRDPRSQRRRDRTAARAPGR